MGVKFLVDRRQLFQTFCEKGRGYGEVFVAPAHPAGVRDGIGFPEHASR